MDALIFSMASVNVCSCLLETSESSTMTGARTSQPRPFVSTFIDKTFRATARVPARPLNSTISSLSSEDRNTGQSWNTIIDLSYVIAFGSYELTISTDLQVCPAWNVDSRSTSFHTPKAALITRLPDSNTLRAGPSNLETSCSTVTPPSLMSVRFLAKYVCLSLEVSITFAPSHFSVTFLSSPFIACVRMSRTSANVRLKSSMTCDKWPAAPDMMKALLLWLSFVSRDGSSGSRELALQSLAQPRVVRSSFGSSSLLVTPSRQTGYPNL